MYWIIVDNSPEAGGSPAADVVYEHQASNVGVSAAYLRGAELAKAHGCQWLLLLDQDSHFPTHWFEEYAAALGSFPNATLLVPAVPAGKKWISPAGYRWHRGWLNNPMPKGPFRLNHYAPINAGMLIQRSAYEACGGHESKVQLDFSDFAFLHKFKKQNSYAFLVEFSLQHSLSGIEKSSFEQRITRFGHYCRDAAAFARSGGPTAWLIWWAAWRTLLLSLRYRRLQFFSVFWREFNRP